MKHRFNSKTLTMLLTAVMVSVSLFGCAPKETTKEAPKAEVQTKTSSKETVEITDHAGRTVEIPSPEKLEKVYFTSPIGLILAYTMNPDKLAGTPTPVAPPQAKLMPKLVGLEELGGMQMGGDLNREAIINSGTQIIFSIGPGKIDEKSKTDADELQSQLNIPVVVVTGIFEEVDKTYELLGKIYGEEKRAEELSSYCMNVIKDVDEKLSDIKEEEMVKVYYAEGPDGLSTEPSGSGHSVVLNHAKANNVAKIEAKQGSGMTPVSMEQIIEWNPELIISWSDQKGGAYSTIKEDGVWKEITAVQNGAIYTTPDLPFTWIDRPPSVNRFLGLQWMANLLYPDKYDIDIVETSKDFCKKFYNVELTDEQINDILKTSIISN